MSIGLLLLGVTYLFLVAANPRLVGSLLSMFDMSSLLSQRNWSVLNYTWFFIPPILLSVGIWLTTRCAGSFAGLRWRTVVAQTVVLLWLGLLLRPIVEEVARTNAWPWARALPMRLLEATEDSRRLIVIICGTVLAAFAIRGYAKRYNIRWPMNRHRIVTLVFIVLGLSAGAAIASMMEWRDLRHLFAPMRLVAMTSVIAILAPLSLRLYCPRYRTYALILIWWSLIVLIATLLGWKFQFEHPQLPTFWSHVDIYILIPVRSMNPIVTFAIACWCLLFRHRLVPQDLKS